MYTRFSGEKGQSAARWLRTLKYELPISFTAGQWLECVDGLLGGEAARWADVRPNVRKILSDEALKHANNQDVDAFKALLISRFASAAENLEEVNHQMENLRQGSKESLHDYYRRAEDLLHALGGRDDVGPVALDANERSILTRVIDRFVSGLDEEDLGADVSPESDSLRQAYQTIREAE